MAKDLTPKEFKCAMSMACPGVFKLEDGRLLIVGEDGAAHAYLAGKIINAGEEAIVIDPGLLDNVLKCKCQADDTAKGEVVSANASSIERSAETLSLSMALGIGKAVADCCDPPVIRGIFSSLNEHFPEFKFELDDDYGALVTLLDEGIKPAERTADATAEAWRLIETFPDSDDHPVLSEGVVLWNTCDGVHCVHPVDLMKPEWLDLMFDRPEDRNRTFSHWMPVIEPSDARQIALRQIEEARSADERTAETADASLTPNSTPQEAPAGPGDDNG